MTSLNPLLATREWFEEQIRPIERDVRTYVSSRFGRLAEVDDVMQESYMKLLRIRGRTEILDPRRLLFRLARNEACNMLRKRRAAPVADLPEFDVGRVVEQGECVRDTLDGQWRIAALFAALDQMPPVRAKVLRLRLEGLRRREIAARLGLSVYTISNHLTLGIKQCREIIAEQFTSPDDGGGRIHFPDTSSPPSVRLTA